LSLIINIYSLTYPYLTLPAGQLMPISEATVVRPVHIPEMPEG